MAMKLSTGKVAFPIEFDNGAKETIYFNPNDPDLIRSVLQGAKEWLREVLPDVFAKVANFFDELINNVGKWVEKGLNYVIDAIDYLYKKGRTVVEALKEPTDK